MAVRGRRWGEAIITIAVGGLLLATTSLGCGHGGSPSEAAEKPAKVAETKQEPVKPKAAVEARFRQPFAEATRQDPPADWPPPPDQTLSGKSVGKLYEQVVKAWDSIPFVSDDGKRIVYTATIDTDKGPVVLELRPDWAPNHVRNFVALARVNYYDGLLFERTVHQESDVRPGDKLDLIEGGCPLGTGEIGTGSIGYWLKPEYTAEAKHEEGVVGACRGEEADTAACRFYISLCKAPYLDGQYTVFGKVKQGLDVARKVFEQPVKQEDGDVEGDHRPVNPVVIRKVTITTKEVDKPGPGGEN